MLIDWTTLRVQCPVFLVSWYTDNSNNCPLLQMVYKKMTKLYTNKQKARSMVSPGLRSSLLNALLVRYSIRSQIVDIHHFVIMGVRIHGRAQLITHNTKRILGCLVHNMEALVEVNRI